MVARDRALADADVRPARVIGPTCNYAATRLVRGDGSHCLHDCWRWRGQDVNAGLHKMRPPHLAASTAVSDPATGTGIYPGRSEPAGLPN